MSSEILEEGTVTTLILPEPKNTMEEATELKILHTDVETKEGKELLPYKDA